MNFYIVYSALHTGTWLICEILKTAIGPIVPHSDSWLSEISTKNIEEFSNGKLNSKWKEEFMNSVPEHYLHNSNDFLLQGHHRETEASMYKNLLINKPNVKIIIPVRDLLLSLNSRIWRECGSLKTFNEESIEKRIERIKNQADSLFDLLRIPNKHAFFLPIDTEEMKDTNYRLNICKEMLDFCELKENKSFKDFITNWKVINNTYQGKYPQKFLHKSGLDDTFFQDIKMNIINKEKEKVISFLDHEIQYIKDNYLYGIDQMKALGYKDLLWF